MRKAILILAVLFTASLGAVGEDKAPGVTADGADEVTVLIKAGDSRGSGVLFKNGERTLVWTDAHVVSDTQKVATVVDPQTGAPKVVVTYSDVTVLTEQFQDGRKIGETTRDAKVVRYGWADDIALLYVYEKNYGKSSAKFSFAVPKKGDALWHVGCVHGSVAPNSVSDGVVASSGRLHGSPAGTKVLYDQVSLVAHHGCSGGGVFLKSTGECVGLIDQFVSIDPLFTHSSFLITPARRMKEFAKRTSCEWALDAGVKVPDLEAIMAGRVTDTPVPVPADFPK